MSLCASDTRKPLFRKDGGQSLSGWTIVDEGDAVYVQVTTVPPLLLRTCGRLILAHVREQATQPSDIAPQTVPTR